MDKAIKSFLENNSVFTLATISDDTPNCAICFYAFDSLNNRLIFKSKETTKHVKDLLAQPKIAGSIHSGNINIRNLKGLQFAGTYFEPVSTNEEQQSIEIYNKAFPFSKMIKGTIYSIDLDYVKMTDNSYGMGKKIIWSRVPQEQIETVKAEY